MKKKRTKSFITYETLLNFTQKGGRRRWWWWKKNESVMFEWNCL